MELTSRIKMTRSQTFWIQMRKNKPLDEIRKTGQTAKHAPFFFFARWPQGCIRCSTPY
ncbi:hypothetical protein Hanom_Chr14g01270131 [Helianthus anomalus]